MENTTPARECGRRLRRIRQARNMSQQMLADLLLMTPQNISKYEKEGINSIDVIMQINAALDCNLLKDEIDVEGTIGEIGKEILCVLVQCNGFIEVDHLVKNCMYGLAEKQVTKEIVKLENIGLCVREQYVGLVGDEHDGLFITAKGLIALKNNLNPGVLVGLLSKEKDNVSKWIQKDTHTDYLGTVGPEEFTTYEQLVLSEGYETYQDLLDAMELERMVWQLPGNSVYRADFIAFLKKEYGEDTWFGKKTFEESALSTMQQYGVLSAENAYTDILHRMVSNLSDELLERLCISFYEQVDDWELAEGMRDNFISKYSSEYEACRKMGKIKANTILHFTQLSEWYREYINDSGIGVFDNSALTHDVYRQLDKTNFSEEDKKLAEEYELMEEQSHEDCYALEPSFDYCLENLSEGKNNPLVTEWFSKEEIESFIEQNIRPAETDDERAIDELLLEICKKYPEVLSYFEFPEEWEENGLADLVRRNVNLF